MLAYYGYKKDIYGVQQLMPMPSFREDIITTSGPRSLTFAVWANLNKWGNNDAILSQSLISVNYCDQNYKKSKQECSIMKALPKTDTIKIGGKDYTLERFGSFVYNRDDGFRTKSGRWHGPKELMWKQPNGKMDPQLWIFDMTDHVDIFSPNYVTKFSLEEFSNKYKNKPLVQEMFFENWFSKYFKTNEGRYADPLINKRAIFNE